MSISKERNLAINLIYSWAQDHTDKFTIAGSTQSDASVDVCSNNLTYIVRHNGITLDLLLLIDRMELMLKNKLTGQKVDGCFCNKCNEWYEMALPNQPDGTLICYTCRNP